MNPRIENWVNEQKRVVEHDGISVRRVVLVGPENDALGTWSIDHEELAKTIDRVMQEYQDEAPLGIHRCKLVGLDGSGVQLAQLPLRMHGKQSAAQLGSGNPNAIQRANATFLSSIEQLVRLKDNALERAQEALDSRTDDLSTMVELHLKHEASNEELEERRLERAQQREFKDQVFKVLEGMLPMIAEPLLSAITKKMALELELKNLEAEEKVKQLKAKKAPLPPGYPSPQPGETTAPKGETTAPKGETAKDAPAGQPAGQSAAAVGSTAATPPGAASGNTPPAAPVAADASRGAAPDGSEPPPAEPAESGQAPEPAVVPRGDTAGAATDQAGASRAPGTAPRPTPTRIALGRPCLLLLRRPVAHPPITNPLTALAMTALTRPELMKPMVHQAGRQVAGLALGALGDRLLAGDEPLPADAYSPATGSGK